MTASTSTNPEAGGELLVDEISIHLMCGTIPSDDELRLLCAHVACIYNAYAELDTDVHLYVIAQDVGRILPFLHPVWRRHVGPKSVDIVNAGIRTAKGVSIFPIGSDENGDVEVWVAPKDLVESKCVVCNTRYASSVNANRCRAAHPPTVIKGRAEPPVPLPDKERIVVEYWDAAAPDVRAELVGPIVLAARSVLPDTISDAFPPQCKLFLKALCGETDVSGEAIVRGMDVASEGTYAYPHIRDRTAIDRPTLVRDRLAVFAYVFGDRIADAYAAKNHAELFVEELSKERERVKSDQEKARKAKKRRERKQRLVQQWLDAESDVLVYRLFQSNGDDVDDEALKNVDLLQCVREKVAEKTGAAVRAASEAERVLREAEAFERAWHKRLAASPLGPNPRGERVFDERRAQRFLETRCVETKTWLACAKHVETAEELELCNTVNAALSNM